MGGRGGKSARESFFGGEAGDGLSYSDLLLELDILHNLP